MRDDRTKWPMTQGAERPNILRGMMSVRQITLARQTVISGAIENCLLVIGKERATQGGLDIATGNAYAVRQRRDRILVVNGPALSDGWNADHNVAVSDMTSAYGVIEISGARVEQLIATGTEFSGQAVSPSVSRMWHGFGILLYRYGAEDVFRMHVRSALIDAVWEMIERQLDALDRIQDKDFVAYPLSNGHSEASLNRKEAS